MANEIENGYETLKALSNSLYLKTFPVHTALWLHKLSFPPEEHLQAPGWQYLPGPDVRLAPMDRRLLSRLAWCFAYSSAGEDSGPIIRPQDTSDEAPFYFKGPGHEPLDKKAIKHSWKLVCRALASYSKAANGRRTATYCHLMLRTANCYWLIRGAVLETIFRPLHEAMLSRPQETKLDREFKWAWNCFLATYNREPRPNRTLEEREEEKEWREEMGPAFYTGKRTKPPKILDLQNPVDGLGPYALQYRGLPLFNYLPLRKEYQALGRVPAKTRRQLQFMSESDWTRLDGTAKDFGTWAGWLYPEAKILTATAWSNEAAFKRSHPSRRKRSRG